MGGACVPTTDMQKEFYPTFFVNFIHVEHYAQPDNFDNPIQSIVVSDSFAGNLQTISGNNYLLSNIDFYSDEGFLIESNRYINGFNTEKFDSRITMEDNPPFYMINKVYLSNLNSLYKRSYVKIQQILANTGGIIKVFLILINFITQYFDKFILIEKLYNECVNNSVSEENNLQDFIKKNTDNRKISTKAPYVDNDRKEESKLNIIRKNLKEEKKNDQKETFRIHFIDQIKILFCPKSKISNNFEQIRESVNNNLDIIQLFRAIDYFKNKSKKDIDNLTGTGINAISTQFNLFKKSGNNNLSKSELLNVNGKKVLKDNK